MEEIQQTKLKHFKFLVELLAENWILSWIYSKVLLLLQLYTVFNQYVCVYHLL